MTQTPRKKTFRVRSGFTVFAPGYTTVAAAQEFGNYMRSPIHKNPRVFEQAFRGDHITLDNQKFTVIDTDYEGDYPCVSVLPGWHEEAAIEGEDTLGCRILPVSAFDI